MKIVKFDKTYIFEHILTDNGFRMVSYEAERKSLEDGRVALSLKFGKRRRLVKGFINTRWSYGLGGYSIDANEKVKSFYFIPNDRQKFMEVMAKSSV